MSINSTDTTQYVLHLMQINTLNLSILNISTDRIDKGNTSMEKFLVCGL